jgi:SAM-dependent methyltransferase
MQSPEEWGARNRILAKGMADLVNQFAGESKDVSGDGLDVGCQKGALTDAMEEQTGFHWVGIDPTIDAPTKSVAGLDLLPGTADRLAFDDGAFQVALFANVYEHVLPELREASLTEIRRVLAPGGHVIGQIPNPYFPIESHSRLPFMGWLPMRAQKVYWRLSPVPWEHDFFVVTMKQLSATAAGLGLRTLYSENFNYPPEVIPQALRSTWRRLERPMRRMPWAWQFVLQRVD